MTTGSNTYVIPATSSSTAAQQTPTTVTDDNGESYTVYFGSGLIGTTINAAGSMKRQAGSAQSLGNTTFEQCLESCDGTLACVAVSYLGVSCLLYSEVTSQIFVLGGVVAYNNARFHGFGSTASSSTTTPGSTTLLSIAYPASTSLVSSAAAFGSSSTTLSLLFYSSTVSTAPTTVIISSTVASSSAAISPTRSASSAVVSSPTPSVSLPNASPSSLATSNTLTLSSSLLTSVSLISGTTPVSASSLASSSAVVSSAVSSQSTVSSTSIAISSSTVSGQSISASALQSSVLPSSGASTASKSGSSPQASTSSTPQSSTSSGHSSSSSVQSSTSTSNSALNVASSSTSTSSSAVIVPSLSTSTSSSRSSSTSVHSSTSTSSSHASSSSIHSSASISSSVVIVPYSATSVGSSSTITSSTAVPSSTPVKNTGKRGLAYTNSTLTNLYSLSGQNSKVSWGYDWYYANQTSTSSTVINPALTFIPLLYDDSSSVTVPWPTYAQLAIDEGADALFSFNEPDLCYSGSACMSVNASVTGYLKYMQPFAGTVKLGAPAVSNSGAPGGLTYLSEFVGNCTGCTIDFVNVHWYSNYYAGLSYLQSFITEAYDMFGLPIYLSEFGLDDSAGTPTDTQIQAFLQEALPWLDAYPHVHRYAYFYNGPGYLVNQTTGGLSGDGVIYNSYTATCGNWDNTNGTC